MHVLHNYITHAGMSYNCMYPGVYWGRNTLSQTQNSVDLRLIDTNKTAHTSFNVLVKAINLYSSVAFIARPVIDWFLSRVPSVDTSSI